MQDSQAPSTTTTRPQVEVTCSRCKAQATVPFQPTPGRPVYCRACFERQPAARGPRGRGGPAGGRPNVQPAKRMLSMRRKGHFVYDALASLDEENQMDEDQRRTFVEMVFTRGARQDTATAQEFLDEKREEGIVSDEEASTIARVLDRYTERR